MMAIRDTVGEPNYEPPRKPRAPSLNRRGRVWRPNNCPDVVLECGAVETAWLQVRRDGDEWQHCPVHGELERIVRDATLTDLMEWRSQRWQETTEH